MYVQYNKKIDRSCPLCCGSCYSVTSHKMSTWVSTWMNSVTVLQLSPWCNWDIPQASLFCRRCIATLPPAEHGMANKRASLTPFWWNRDFSSLGRHSNSLHSVPHTRLKWEHILHDKLAWFLWVLYTHSLFGHDLANLRQLEERTASSSLVTNTHSNRMDEILPQTFASRLSSVYCE